METWRPHLISQALTSEFLVKKARDYDMTLDPQKPATWFLSATQFVDLAEKLLTELTMKEEPLLPFARHGMNGKFFEPLIKSKDLLCHAIKAEFKIQERGEVPFWRYTTNFATQDTKKWGWSDRANDYEEIYPTHSYAYGLLSGYLADGYKYLKLEFRFKALSACTFCYTYADQMVADLCNDPTQTRAQQVQDYYNERANHMLYVIGIPPEHAFRPKYFGHYNPNSANARQFKWITEKADTVEDQLRTGRGEYFHPKVQVSPENTAYKNAIDNKIVVSLGGVLQPFDSSVLASDQDHSIPPEDRAKAGPADA